MILRYDDVHEALRDPRLSSDRVRTVYETRLSPAEQLERAATFDVLQNWMVFNDPPAHTRLRRLVSSAFTPRAIEQLRPRVEVVVASLLDDIENRDEIDLVNDFAYQIPAVIIAEMMGVPAEDRHLFKEWSACIMALVFGGVDSPETRYRSQIGLIELIDYLHGLVAQYRRQPQENIISSLVVAGQADDSLTDDEIVSTCTLLLFGGHETTTNLIGNGARVLLQHPDQLERFRTDASITQSAIEELLRFDGPSRLEVRRVSADLTLGGRLLREGDQVFLMQASANRDQNAFLNPDELQLEREPNRHLGFGFGLHFCLGAAVARLEGSIGLSRLFERFPDMKLKNEPAQWHPLLVSRGMSRLAVHLRSTANP